MTVRLKPLLIAVMAIAAITATVQRQNVPQYVWNLTPSVPEGLYAVEPARYLRITMLVVVRPPQPLASLLDDGGYLPPGVPLLKRMDMVSIFPWPLIELCAARDGLCAIPVREQLDESTVGIITRAGQPSDAAASCFTDCLIETIRDESWVRTPDILRAAHSVEILV